MAAGRFRTSTNDIKYYKGRIFQRGYGLGGFFQRMKNLPWMNRILPGLKKYGRKLAIAAVNDLLPPPSEDYSMQLPSPSSSLAVKRRLLSNRSSPRSDKRARGSAPKPIKGATKGRKATIPSKKPKRAVEVF